MRNRFITLVCGICGMSFTILLFLKLVSILKCSWIFVFLPILVGWVVQIVWLLITMKIEFSKYKNTQNNEQDEHL